MKKTENKILTSYRDLLTILLRQMERLRDFINLLVLTTGEKIVVEMEDYLPMVVEFRDYQKRLEDFYWMESQLILIW